MGHGMPLLDENLACLGQRAPALARLLQAPAAGRCRLEPARNGQATLQYASAAGPLYLHSKFDPGAEAARVVAGLDLASDHLVVFGLGLGYHLAPLLQAKPVPARVLLLEPDLEIVRACLQVLDWRRLLERPDFFPVFGPDLQAAVDAVPAFFQVVSGDTPRFVEWPAEGRIFRSFFDEARRVIENEIHTLVVDFSTRLAESDLVPRNVLKNAPALLATRPVRPLQRRFAGVPGFIVGAGPSLDANVLELQEVADRAVIVCVDTALKPLLARGIQPHFTVVADPSHKNYLHLQGTEKRLRHWLVAEPAVAAPVYRDFGERLFSVSIGRPMVRLIEENSRPLGEVDAWGSVISLAVGFSAWIGLDPVVFLGQDFAFTHMRNHCRHTSWEERWRESARELDDLQRREARSIRGNNRVSETRDVFGRPTLTSDRLQLYKNYLVRKLRAHPGVRYINASAGGCFTEIPWQPLDGVLAEHLANREPLDLAWLERVPPLGGAPERRRLRAFFAAKRDFFRSYRRQAAATAGGLAPQPTAAALAEAERVHRKLYDNPQHGVIAESWSQAPIYHFLRRSRRLESNPEAQPVERGALYRDYFASLDGALQGIGDGFAAATSALDDAL